MFPLIGILFPVTAESEVRGRKRGYLSSLKKTTTTFNLSFPSRIPLTFLDGQSVSDCGRASDRSSPNVRAGLRGRDFTDGGGVCTGTSEPDRRAY